MNHTLRRPAARLAAFATAALMAMPSAASGQSAGAIVASVVVRSLDVALELSTERVDVGDRFQAKVTIANPGSEALRWVEVELKVDRGGLVIDGPSTKTIKRVGRDRTAGVTWSVQGREAGAYLIVAQVSVDGFSIETPARLLIVG